MPVARVTEIEAKVEVTEDEIDEFIEEHPKTVRKKANYEKRDHRDVAASLAAGYKVMQGDDFRVTSVSTETMYDDDGTMLEWDDVTPDKTKDER